MNWLNLSYLCSLFVKAVDHWDSTTLLSVQHCFIHSTRYYDQLLLKCTQDSNSYCNLHTWSMRLSTETYCSSVERSSQAIRWASLIRPVQCLDNSTMLFAPDFSSRFSSRTGFESSPSSSIPASSDVVYEMSESSDGTALMGRAGLPVLRLPFRTMLEFL